MFMESKQRTALFVLLESLAMLGWCLIISRLLVSLVNWILGVGVSDWLHLLLFWLSSAGVLFIILYSIERLRLSEELRKATLPKNNNTLRKDFKMSHIITSWKTKSIKDFKIPLVALCRMTGVIMSFPCDGLNVVHISYCGSGLKAETSCEFRIAGVLLENGDVLVDVITNSGYFSESIQPRLLQAFQQSTGELVAVQLWDMGESATRVTVRNGNVSVEDIDI
jgi:hypothetical protein